MDQSQESFLVEQPKKKGRGNRNKNNDQQEKQENKQISNESFMQQKKENKKKKQTSQAQLSFLLGPPGDKSNTLLQTLDQNDQKNESDSDSDKQKQKKEDDQSQLQPDQANKSKLNQSNWLDDKKNSKEKQKKSSQPKRQRGNRSPQKKTTYRQKQKQSDYQKGKSQINPDHQLPSKPENQQQPKRRGNRFPENQNQNNGFRKKNYQQDGGRNYRGNQNDNYRGRGRGGRGGRGRGGYHYQRDYNNRNFNNNEYNRSQQTRNFDKNETDKQCDESTYKNPNFTKKNSHFQSDNRSTYSQRPHYNQNNRGGYYNKPEPQIIKQIVQKQVTKEVVVVKQVQKPRPNGRRVQPQMSIFVKKCKITLTCRRLEQFSVEVIVIPYKTAKMELYPSQIINSCQINYKQKIKAKGQLLQKQGSIYLQQSRGYPKAKSFAFLKIGDPQNSLKTGVSNLFQNLKHIPQQQKQKRNINFQTIIFPICEKLSGFKTLIHSIINEVQKYPFIKDVYISTEQSKTFCQAVSKFNQIFQELFQDNDISMN